MKKWVTLSWAACLTFGLGSCLAQSADPAKKFTKFEGAPITGLEIGSAFEVVIEQGSVAKAEFEVSADWVDRLHVEVDDDGILDVSIRNWDHLSKNPTLKLKLTCPTLEEVDASGAASIQVQGPFTASTLKVDASGASVVKFNQPITVSAGAEIDVSGASVVQINGTAEWVDVEASGASKVQLSKLTTPRIRCGASGASSVEAFAWQEATGEASGASSVTIQGGGEINFDRVSGASSVSTK